MPRALRIVCWLLFIFLASTARAASGQVILVYGDSLSSAYGMPAERGWVAMLDQRLKREQLNYSVVNASISGETTAGGVSRIAKTLERTKPAIVILELGGNDGLRGLPVAAMKKNLSTMIQQSLKSGAKVLLVGMQIPPNYGESYAKSFSGAYSELAKEHKVALLPLLVDGIAEKLEYFQPDRIHPTEAAQPELLKNVWGALQPLLRKR